MKCFISIFNIKKKQHTIKPLFNLGIPAKYIKSRQKYLKDRYMNKYGFKKKKTLGVKNIFLKHNYLFINWQSLNVGKF